VSALTPSIAASDLITAFNALFEIPESTILVGGGDEPFYLPAEGHRPAQIQFRADYLRSALHEVAHWCVAGVERRKLPDYGYWYSPDDRDLPQQRAFFTVEARPQAIERHFCEALGIDFRPSLDNLSLQIPKDDEDRFLQRLEHWHARFNDVDLPERAAVFREALRRLVERRAA
jgi:elongation factor P hydroxylase